MPGELITRTVLEDLAGATAFRRGEEYFSSGAVERFRATDGKVTAKVKGTEIYQVELREDDDGELGYDCTCPRAADGYFCKHCAAVGLAWLEEQAGKSDPCVRSSKKERRDPWREIREYLTTQAPAALIALLPDMAQRDDRLYRSLLLKAERASGGDNVAKAFRRAIDDATRIHEFIDWREVGSFATNVDEVVDSLAELLKPNTAAALVDLAEYAIERLEHSLEQIDDSNGEVGAIVERLGELHLKACVMARPEPAALAERLLRLEMTLPFGLCSFDASRYRAALGKLGLLRYRELAEAEWRKVEPRISGDRYDARRFRIFEERPDLEHYKKLQVVAGKLGVWPAQRSRALSLVADRVARVTTTTNKWKPKPSTPDQSLRVEIALWEQRGLCGGNQADSQDRPVDEGSRSITATFRLSG